MVEEVREIKITVYINTNKTTYVETFSNLCDAIEYFEAIIDDLD